MPISSSPATNPFLSQIASRNSPALRAIVVTPNDAIDLDIYAKALRVLNTASEVATVRVTYAAEEGDATTVDLKFPSGLTIEPSSIRRIWNTGTTAGLSIIAYLG